MDPELKKMLEETKSLAEDNNKMLRKMRNMQKWASFWSVLKWILIIGITWGSFYVLQPYVDKLKSMYDSVSGGAEKLSSGSFQNFFNKSGN